ncbi:putative FAS1 domain-containing protein [Lupinus albus]|uniref:Putative FAS1 domain-containing protein n=1 Tax=Lupinus albus TaxID=3870 RepID=A0A6A4PT22_LUPAL|nr:putative FAS1 domain-containing protein [Lupinus albus]
MDNNHHSSHHHHHHLLLLLILLTMLTTTTPQPISPSPSPSPSQSPSKPIEVQQMNNIMDALIGANDFTTMLNPKMLPLTLTLFIPHHNTFFHNNNNHPPLDPFLFPYHVIPQRLTFSDLLLLPPTTNLPTLLPYRTISVTNNSATNYSLNGVPLTHPDLYSTPSLVVHGVANILDYSLSGDGIPSPPPPLDDGMLLPPFGLKSGVRCATSLWCTRVVFFIFWCCFLLQR